MDACTTYAWDFKMKLIYSNDRKQRAIKCRFFGLFQDCGKGTAENCLLACSVLAPHSFILTTINILSQLFILASSVPDLTISDLLLCFLSVLFNHSPSRHQPHTANPLQSFSSTNCPQEFFSYQFLFTFLLCYVFVKLLVQLVKINYTEI